MEKIKELWNKHKRVCVTVVVGVVAIVVYLVSDQEFDFQGITDKICSLVGCESAI